LRAARPDRAPAAAALAHAFAAEGGRGALHRDLGPRPGPRARPAGERRGDGRVLVLHRLQQERTAARIRAARSRRDPDGYRALRAAPSPRERRIEAPRVPLTATAPARHG